MTPEQPSDEARRAAEAWRIVHEYGPRWHNEYWGKFPNSKASVQRLRDECAHYCVVASLETKETELDAARAEIAALKDEATKHEEHRRLISEAAHLVKTSPELARLRSRSAAPSGDLRAENERLLKIEIAAQSAVKAAYFYDGFNPLIPQLQFTILESALASPQPDAGANGKGTRMHLHPMKDRPDLTALIEKAKRAYETMSPEEKEAHDKAQRESWVRGEMELAQLERETAVDAPSPSPEAAPTSEDAMKKALPALNAEAIKLADAAFEGWRLNYPNDENVQYAWGSIYFHSSPTPWSDLRTHVVQSIFTAGQRAFRAALHDILAEVAAQEPGQ